MLKIGLVLAVTAVAQFLTFLMISETVQLALVGSVVPTIAAVGAIFIGWWSNRKIARDAVDAAKKNYEAIEVVDKKTDKVIGQNTEIHTLTNSNLTKVQSQLDVALERIKGMEELVKSMATAKTVADDLSTKKASSLTAASTSSEVDPIPVADAVVADLLKSTVIDKLDSIQLTVDEPKADK